MSFMPVWLQVVLPFSTAAVTFVLTRTGGVLDRRRQRKEIERSSAPSFVIDCFGDEQYRLTNCGDAPATNIGLVLDDGVVRWLPANRQIAPQESAIMVFTTKVHQVGVMCSERPLAQIVPVPT